MKGITRTSITCHRGLLILLVPLFLSSFTHLWNPTGFPWIHEDEGHYMRRAMQVYEGFGPQETRLDFDRPYDHPYFGQIFLASTLSMVGYPNTIKSSPSFSGSEQSTEIFYFAPRLLMGVLAIIDTFLVFKIAERRYDVKVALFASVLFAVMPLTWLLRGVFLDNILLPFVLLSILFALNMRGSQGEMSYSDRSHHYLRGSNRLVILATLSGIFLGIAIFSKISACTMIPLVAFIIYRYNKNLKLLAIWFMPVVIIAAIWPIYNIWSGHFDDWLAGIVWQASQRLERPLSSAITVMMRIDPVLAALGMAGLAYAALLEIRSRNFFITLWMVPYLIFLYLIDWVLYFHWIILLPGLSISAAALIKDLASKINRIPKLTPYITATIISVIGIFGLISSSLLIINNVTSSYFELYSFIVQYLTEINQDKDLFEGQGDTTIVGHRWTWAFSWIPRYIVDYNIHFVPFNSTDQVRTDRFLLLVDNYVNRHLSDKDLLGAEIVQTLYNNSYPIKKIKDATVAYNEDIYPYSSMSENRGIGRYSPVEIRVNR